MPATSITLEEQALLDSPACARCNHRLGLHIEDYEYGGHACIVCHCDGDSIGPITERDHYALMAGVASNDNGGCSIPVWYARRGPMMGSMA